MLQYSGDNGSSKIMWLNYLITQLYNTIISFSITQILMTIYIIYTRYIFQYIEPTFWPAIDICINKRHIERENTEPTLSERYSVIRVQSLNIFIYAMKL